MSQPVWQAPGTHSAGSTVASPGWPAGIADKELAILFVGWGNSTSTPPPTPSGFVAPPNNNFQGGSGTFGVDSGIRGITVFTRVCDGTESGTVTVNNGGTGTTATTSAQIMRISPSAAGKTFAVTVVGGSDNTAGSGFSVTGNADPGSVDTDLLIASGVWVPDTQALTSPTIVHSGTGVVTTISVQTVANAQGNDLRFFIVRRFSEGTSTAAPQFTATGGATTAGAVAFTLVHEVDPVAAPSGWGIAV